MEWRVRLVDYDGVGVAELDNAVITQVPSKRLHDIGRFAFKMPVGDAKASLCQIGEARVQVWRDDLLWWIGEIVRPQASSGDDWVTFQCRDAKWPFTRRFVGKADRTNLVDDPEMEDEDAWTAGSGGGDPAPTDTYETSTRVLGAQSLKLVSANFGLNAYASQTFSHTAGSIDDVIIVAAWFYVDPTGYLGPAWDNRGLYIFQDFGGVPEGADLGVFEIDDTMVGEWQRAETYCFVPAGETADVEVRLYSPGGDIYWDAVTCTLMESQSYTDTDQASIVAQLVAHAQDTAYQKSTLNIGTDCPSTSVLRSRYYQHAEHQNVWDALLEFTELENGVDLDLVWDATGETLEFTTYYPSKGTARDRKYALELTADGSRGIAAWSWSFDGENAANNIVVLGDGDGPDREEGGARDPSVFGGMILEDVVGPFTGAPIDTLDERASELLAARKRAEVLEIVTSADMDSLLYGVLELGDTLPVKIDRGYVQVDDDWRVVGMEPVLTGGMRLELNLASSVPIRRPDPMREISKLRRQVRDLKRKIVERVPGSTVDPIPFGVSGTVTTGTTPQTRMAFNGTGVYANLNLETASSSGSVTARLLKNGAAVTNSALTLAASATESDHQYFPVSWVKGDYLSMEVTAAGTGAENLNYDLYFRRAQ